MKSRLFFVLAASLMMLLACNKEEQAVFEVSGKDVIEIGYKARIVEIPLRASADVTVSMSASWMKFSLEHNPDIAPDGKLLLDIPENTSSDSRETVVRLSMLGGNDHQIRIRQESSSNVLDEFVLDASLNSLKETVVFDFKSDESMFCAKYLYWIESDKPEMFVPSFKSKGTVTLADGTALVPGQTQISLEKDIEISVRMPSGDVYDYTVSLNCPQINGELPVLHMKPDQMIADKENYVDTHIELFDKTASSTGEGWWDSDEQGKVEMRGRGNSTWILQKKPFRLKFPEKFSPIGLDHAKAKSWTLLAQDMDKSLLRTHLAFEYSRVLFNPSEGYHHDKAVLFTPCSRYVNVYLTGDYYDSATGRTSYKDGEYMGVYQMSDQVERADGRIAVDKLEEKDGDDPDKITGGYIIETDVHDGTHFSALRNVKMSYKYPKDDDFAPAQYEYITNFLNEMEAVLFSENYKDEEEGWRKYLDIKTLADFIIVKELAADMDGLTSTYMYKRRGVDKLFFGPIWDCDKGWDNEKRTDSQYPISSNLMIHAGFGLPGCSGEDWYERLWTDNELRRFIAERWAAKKEQLLAVTDKVLDEVPASMSKAIDANFTVWKFNFQSSSEAKMPAETYEAEIERIRELTYERAALLDRLFNETVR